MDLINKLRKHPNSLDCHDAALALEQATVLLKKSMKQWYTGDSTWTQEVHYWLNTWDKNEEEE